MVAENNKKKLKSKRRKKSIDKTLRNNNSKSIKIRTLYHPLIYSNSRLRLRKRREELRSMNLIQLLRKKRIALAEVESILIVMPAC